MNFRLKTLGHATLVLLQDDEPLIATDPWLIGSVYWRSWWLEQYPTADEIDLVRRARELYITHSHPDHFHWPTLRHLGPRSTLHPTFPRNPLPEFLEQNGFPSRKMDPWRWYQLGEKARALSIPNLLDDSILVIDTPNATVVNLNDAAPRRSLLKTIRSRLLTPGKRVLVMRSYSPASAVTSMFIDDRRVPIKSKRDYVIVAREMAESLGATHFIPFASQAFFSRSDSRWANEYKVTQEDLQEHWGESMVNLCPPFVDFDLDAGEFSSRYQPHRTLDAKRLEKVHERESEESDFVLPVDFDENLKKYMDGLRLLPAFFRRGVGFRLKSGAERFYDSRKRRVGHTIPESHDIVISLPDKVLDEALRNKMLTDLGITMFIRVDTKVGLNRAYALFLLMGIHDYGYLDSLRNAARCGQFYAPALIPMLTSVLRKKLNV